MKSRHTPRPWHVEDGPDIDLRDGDRYLTVLGPDSHGSPHIAVWDGSSQGGTAEANAHLVAAAPDLLAAARHAVCGCTDEQRDRGHVVGCWFPALQVAIEKADGDELAAECCDAEAAQEHARPSFESLSEIDKAFVYVMHALMGLVAKGIATSVGNAPRLTGRGRALAEEMERSGYEPAHDLLVAVVRVLAEPTEGGAALEAAGLEPVDGWDSQRHITRTRCNRCDNDIEAGGCRCARPDPSEPTRLEVLDCMQSMGGGFVAALAVAWMKADQDNDRRLRAAFPHYWKQYTETLKFQKARVYSRVMKGGVR